MSDQQGAVQATVPVAESPDEHCTDDPVPPEEGATEEEWESYKVKLGKYSAEMMAYYEKDTTITGELMWGEFTTLFCKKAIQTLDKYQLNYWRNLLHRKGVFVRMGKGVRRTTALIECMNQEHFISYTESVPSRPLDQEERPPSTEEGDDVNLDPSKATRVDAAQNKQNAVPTKRVYRLPKAVFHEQRDDDEPTVQQRSLGISGLTKCYGNRPRFSGELDQDLQGMINDYRAICGICGLSKVEMARGITVMLEGDAMTFYSTRLTGEADFEKVVKALQSEFTSDEQRTRLLGAWKTTSLMQYMRNFPDKSELEVFKDVVRKLSTIQRQLDEVYQNDISLRDQIVSSTDLPEIAKSLKEKAPKTSHEATQRIANLLSANPGSAGKHAKEIDSAFYGIGTRYGGEARRKYNRPSRNNRSKKRNSMRGCVVCGSDHFARNHHSQDDIVAAIRKKKRTNPKALYAEEIAMLASVDYESSAEDDSSSNDDDDEGNISVFHVKAEPINAQLEVKLSNDTFCHGRFDRIQRKAYDEMNTALAAGEADEFKGIVMDSGANRSSMMSIQQYRVYCQEFGAVANIDPSNAALVRGIGGKSRSIGTAIIPIPFKDLGVTFDTRFHIIDGDVPSLLCLSDMKRQGLDLRILHDRVDHCGRSQKLTYHDALLWHKWTPEDCNYALYTEPELRKLHRSFGHPAASTLANLLKKARPGEFNANVREALDDITRACDPCQRYSPKPRRFKLAVGTEELRFNHIVAVDVMTIEGRPAIHVVDESTHYMAARWLPRLTAKESWKAIRRCWIDVYLGPPDFLRVDQGSSLVSSEFKSNAAAYDIEILEAPVESPSTMSHVERYHPPVRAAYSKLRSELGPDETDDDVLQLAVKAVNDTVGPEGLCPTLLVFGTLPRPARNLPAPQQLARARAIAKAMREIEKEHAHRKVQFGLRYRGPYGREREDLQKLPHGAPVLLYREKLKKWDGPHTFISIEGDTVVVQLPHGRKLFRSHVVKPYLQSAQPAATALNASCNNDDLIHRDEVLSALFGGTDNIPMKPTKEYTFKESREDEWKGLKKGKVFKIVKRNTVPDGVKVHKSRWVDILKVDAQGNKKQKSRLIAQNFRDPGAAKIPTRSPTVTRLAQRIVLASAAMHPSHSFYVRDISQAYIQSKVPLERPVYLEAPKDLGLKEDEVLLVLKPLYGIPESGLHWFATYHDHHVTRLGMTESKADRCLLYKRGSDGNLEAVTMLQVDDSSGHGSDQFLHEEEVGSQTFKCKPRDILKHHV